MRATGTWAGQYTYGDSYETRAQHSVPFTLSLTESLLRRVVGYVRDDASRGGQPERGRIVGKRHGDKVEFVKTMPVGHILQEDGKLEETRTFLERIWKTKLPENLPPHRIHYTGTLDVHGEAMAGTWRILPWLQTADGQELMGGTGTWTANRRSYETSEV